MADRTPLIYPDTCVYLDLVTHNEDPHPDTGQPRWQSALSLFNAVERGSARLVASALIEAEVLCNGQTQSRQNTSTQVADRLRSWFTSPTTLWVDIDRFTAREAALLCAEYSHLRLGSKRMSAADATHLAAAVRAKCGYFMTHDQGFPIKHVIEGVNVQFPNVVWEETLFDQI